MISGTRQKLLEWSKRLYESSRTKRRRDWLRLLAWGWVAVVLTPVVIALMLVGIIWICCPPTPLAVWYLNRIGEFDD